ncbi:MAG: 6,7-dimethyl-8-ribityllumazine synthase [Bdellovibrionota bacterium]|jgi:6,7-dimethyl-8-ribityllumazine synthase
MSVIEGQLSAKGIKFGLVAGRFNSFMTEKLIDGAMDAIVRHGGNKDNVTLVYVPGSFEIPLICKKMAKSGSVDAVIAVGAVIRGSTYHYELVANELAKGLAHASLDTGVPVTFGVITADSIEQAIERSGSKAGNKGAEAALAAIEMVNVIRALDAAKK